MKQRWLLNLALLALVAALAVLAVYKPGQKPEPPTPLTALAPDAVTQLQIARTGQPELQLVRSGDAWRLTAPLAARANPFNVERLVHFAAASAEPVAGSNGLAEFGLEKPQARVRLNGEEIAFGSLHPLENRQYVLYRGAVYLIPNRFFGVVARPWTDFLDTHLLEPDRKLSRLRLPNFTLAFKDGTWERTPADKALSGDRINDFVSEWQHASALSVDRYSGKPALTWVELGFGDAQGAGTLRIGVLARQPELILYRKDEGLEYHFPEEIGQRLLTLSASAGP